jgi:hypothetical protein
MLAQRRSKSHSVIAGGYGGGITCDAPPDMIESTGNVEEPYFSRTSSELMKRRLSRIQTAVAEMTGSMR